MKIRPLARAEDEVDDLLEEFANVVLEGQVMIGVRRNAPVDHEDIETSLQVAANDAFARLKVEYVVPIDEGIAKQHWLRVDGRCLSPVPEEPEFAALEHDVMRSRTDASFPGQLHGPRNGEQTLPDPLLLREVSTLAIRRDVQQRRLHITSVMSDRE